MISKIKVENIRKEIERYVNLLKDYIEIYNQNQNGKTNLTLNSVVSKCRTYSIDANINSTIQLSGLSFNDLNAHYPENMIQPIPEETSTPKALELLKNESFLNGLLNQLKNFFKNTPEFNLALTDIFFQLLTAPETFLFIYLVDADLILKTKDKENTDYQKVSSLFTCFKELLQARSQFYQFYQQELKKAKEEEKNIMNSNQELSITTRIEKLNNSISQFNQNSKILIEFLVEVIMTLLEIQLKSEIFEFY